MKLYALLSLVLFLTMLFAPLFSLPGEGEKTSLSSSSLSDDSQQTTLQNEEKLSVLSVASGKIREVTMEDYVIGCVASEMPLSYEAEALKAQAVAACTYALYMKEKNSSEAAQISDNPAVHQAFSTREELKSKWGDDYEKNMKKITDALQQVRGEYLTYDNQLVCPAYHALSSGTTNNAVDVWGGDIPWLTSVSSASDKLSPAYESSFQFSEKELVGLLDNKKIEKILFGDTVLSGSGYVKSIEISGVSFSGEELRQLLSLRSGSFTVREENGSFIFTCCGYGHGVGMSQYGANEMAKEGFTYDEILTHYYPGIKIEKP